MNQNLTVIVPCYNEEKTITQLIARVLEQEVVREVIVINDASTDNSAQLIKEIQDKRVLYLENSKNLGKGASVKKGFNLATSEYVLNLACPSTSNFALGTVVPIPTNDPLVMSVVPALPTIRFVVVTIPAVI